MTAALQGSDARFAGLDRRDVEAAIAEIRQEAERGVAETLSNPPEFVLLVASLSAPERRGDFLAYPGRLARRKGPPMSVHVLVPSGVALPEGAPPGVALPRVFGRVIERPVSGGRGLTVEAIASF